MKQNKIVIGIDLDGIFVDKPPIIPASFINYLYGDPKKAKLKYNIPNTKFEIFIRRVSHSQFLRPIIKKNVNWLRATYNGTEITCEIITGRYAFLDGVTKSLLLKNGLRLSLNHLWINLDNEQPHLFKERTIKHLKLKYMIDDDIYMLNYLAKRLPDVMFFWYSNSSYFHTSDIEELSKNIRPISDLSELKILIK